MLTGDSDQSLPNESSGRAEIPPLLAGFIDELMTACQGINASGSRAVPLEMHALSDDAGMVSYRNVYLQYRIKGGDKLTLVVSIGWHGSGFHLMAAPDLHFILIRNQWREKANPMLAFDTSSDLAMFLINELDHHGQSLCARLDRSEPASRSQFAM